MIDYWFATDTAGYLTFNAEKDGVKHSKRVIGAVMGPICFIALKQTQETKEFGSVFTADVVEFMATSDNPPVCQMKPEVFASLISYIETLLRAQEERSSMDKVVLPMEPCKSAKKGLKTL